ncbi:MAG TPA: hypothetical protein VIL04_07115 [Solirubrobacterales bacterium]
MRFLTYFMARQVRPIVPTESSRYATGRPRAPQPPFVNGSIGVPPETTALPRRARPERLGAPVTDA